MSLRRPLSALLILGAVLLFALPSAAEPRTSFKIAWSIYVGWMPWGHAADQGIIAKWAEKYGIEIELVQINDYIESINLYTAGKFDGVTMTNMDALTIPAVSGVDTSMVVMGDFSNGNDAIVLKGEGAKLADIKGRNVHLVELSVSHYALARGLDSVGLQERDVTVVNTSDADIVGVFSTPDVTAATLWNPQLGEVLKMPKVTKVFDSSQIPGEIIDGLALNTETLNANPALAKAMTGAWFETVALMLGSDAAATAARTAMGKASGTDLAGYDAQLSTTKMFGDAKAALAFAQSPDLIKTMELVRTFSFSHGLLGEGAPNADVVGIAFPGGKTIGDPANVKLRFDASYVAMAADGKL